MSDDRIDDDCVSKKPWSEVLSRSLKKFTFNAASESGKSFGRVIFFVILGITLLMLATYFVESLTGWFSSWFDFWPFNRGEELVVEPEARQWWQWRSDEPDQIVPTSQPDEEARWYCKWNPLC